MTSSWEDREATIRDFLAERRLSLSAGQCLSLAARASAQARLYGVALNEHFVFEKRLRAAPARLSFNLYPVWLLAGALPFVFERRGAYQPKGPHS